MTPHDPRDPRTGPTGSTPRTPDEIASALLDGLLDADAAARARSRPDVMARVEAMAAARQALRELPVPPHEGRDRAIEAALAAFGDDEHAREPGGHQAAAPPAPVPSPASLDRPRRTEARRPGPARRAPRWLAPVAAVAVVLGLAGLVVATADPGRDGNHEASQAEGGSADEAAGAGDGARESETGGEAYEDAAGAPAVGDAEGHGAAEGGDMTAVAGDLGSFADEDELAAHVDDILVDPAPRQDPPPDAGNDTVCRADPPPLADAQAIRLRARATLSGRSVEVWVVETATGRRLVALAPGAPCTVLVDRPLG